MTVRGGIGRVLAALLAMGAGVLKADTLPVNEVTCPNSGFFSGTAISNVCWSCFFPIRIAGVPLGGTNFPSDAAAPFCVCPGRTGWPSPGITMGMWQPTHMIEVVRQPWCSPVLGKPIIQSSAVDALSQQTRWGGFKHTTSSVDGQSSAFYNFHWWFYPVNIIINAIVGSVCTGQTGYDVDIAYVSEIDPTWLSDELAFYTQPEAILFSNPIAIAACTADAAASTAFKPIRLMYWCAGSWGHAYPFTGNTGSADSPPRMTSLLAFRALAALHRRTLAKRTYGNDAVCHARIAPMIQKQQYRLQTFYPIPETMGNHWMGASTMRWGEWRNIPVKGEDYVWLQWTWKDCCITLW